MCRRKVRSKGRWWGGGQMEKIYNGQMGEKRFEDEGGGERAALAEAGLDCTVEVYMSEESKEGFTVIRQGASPRMRAAKSSDLWYRLNN